MSVISKLTTKDQLKQKIREELRSCARSPQYFLRKYVKIQHPTKGRMLFNLYPYQHESIDIIQENSHIIVAKARQIGFTTLVAGYSLWLMLFHRDKNILIIATKQETAKNLIAKVKFAYDNLPKWMKIECTENNKLSIKFANGSQIKALPSSPDSGRSEAVSLLIFDECAFIRNAKEIWTAAQSTISSGGRAILVSTPNGVGNFFYHTYTTAKNNFHRLKETKNLLKNNLIIPKEEDEILFYPIELDWRCHPDRDEAWEKKERSALDDDDKFAQEYEIHFLSSGNVFIKASVLEYYEKNVQEPIVRTGMADELWIWEHPQLGTPYAVVADVGRGEDSEEGDFSTAHVIDMTRVCQVAEYHGRINTTLFGELLMSLGLRYNNALLVVENSNIGWAVIQTILGGSYPNVFYMTEDVKYVDPDNPKANHALFAENKDELAGFTTSKKTRPLILAKLEEYMRDNSVIINSKRTVDELKTFVWINGKPQASPGCNDDLVISLAIAMWVRDTALTMHSNADKLVKDALEGIHRSNYGYSSITIPTPDGRDPYIVPVYGNNTEDIRWLF